MEITISARNQNIPTQVTPQGNARFAVSFVPFEACEHVINISFNKQTVPGCPIITRVGGDSHVTVSGQALSSAGLGRQSYLTVSNVAGSLEDLEVNVEGESAPPSSKIQHGTFLQSVSAILCGFSCNFVSIVGTLIVCVLTRRCAIHEGLAGDAFCTGHESDVHISNRIASLMSFIR